MELKKNMLFTVTVENCSGNGTGIAHIDGLVVFVQGALRGEQCEIKLLKVKRTVAFAKVERILSSSPHRRKPECPSFPVCGGCSFWHMTYEEELEIKRQQLEETLFRIGGISIPVPPVLGAETIFQYRNKAQFPVAATSKGLQIGFYRARSHDVVSIENCLIQSDAANQAAHALRKWMQRFHIESYNETTHHGLVRHLYIRTNQTGESLICIIINGTTLPQKESFVRILREICLRWSASYSVSIKEKTT